MHTVKSLHDLLLELELRLIEPDVRRSRQALEELLADEFREFGSSSQIYDRQQIVDALQDEPGCRWELRDFEVTELSSECALATYRATRTTIVTGDIVNSLRSSIWVFRDGHWQMLFHQGTRTTD
ncbi:MAG: DUF4440 domain-containing protein [Candidatus Zixiibacteriota bacterium]